MHVRPCRAGDARPSSVLMCTTDRASCERPQAYRSVSVPSSTSWRGPSWGGRPRSTVRRRVHAARGSRKAVRQTSVPLEAYRNGPTKTALSCTPAGEGRVQRKRPLSKWASGMVVCPRACSRRTRLPDTSAGPRCPRSSAGAGFQVSQDGLGLGDVRLFGGDSFALPRRGVPEVCVCVCRARSYTYKRIKYDPA